MTCLALFSFILIVLWVLVFLMIIGTVTISATCGMINEFNQGNAGLFNELDLSKEVKNVFNTCLLPQSSGNFTELFSSSVKPNYDNQKIKDSLESLGIFLEGFSKYSKWRNSDLSKQKESLLILISSQYLQNFQNGGIYDFANI